MVFETKNIRLTSVLKEMKAVFIASYRANKKGVVHYFEAKEMLSRGKTDILGSSAINQEVIKLDI